MWFKYLALSGIAFYFGVILTEQMGIRKGQLKKLETLFKISKYQNLGTHLKFFSNRSFIFVRKQSFFNVGPNHGTSFFNLVIDFSILLKAEHGEFNFPQLWHS